jgi:hypothetical protein
MDIIVFLEKMIEAADQLLMKASRSPLIVAASVVGMPCGKPL